MEAVYSTILAQFELDSLAVSCEKHGHGHINKTYLVITESGRQYVLQKLSNQAFGNIPQLMQNVASVCNYLRKQMDDPRKVLTLVHTIDGNPYFHDDELGDWRMYVFIDNSICLQAVECPRDFYQVAVAFGSFARQLDGFPAETLFETIPNFHDTPDRYRIFKETLAKDPMGRAKDVQAEIDFVLSRESFADQLVSQLKAGILPLRVTHNDTKLNNVMLDKTTREPLCVVDLDTTMPGLLAYDFGDAIRFGASTAAEDEKDLSKVRMDINLFRSYAEGFLSAFPNLTEAEKTSLTIGSKMMTLECGMRFLTDYIDGDHYFGIQYPEQNLDRCRTQFKLVEEMERQWEDMLKIVAELGNKQ